MARHKYLITIDGIDGETKVVGPKHLDEISLTGMLMTLNTASVVGITFTRADLLDRLNMLEKYRIELLDRLNGMKNT